MMMRKKEQANKRTPVKPELMMRKKEQDGIEVLKKEQSTALVPVRNVALEEKKRKYLYNEHGYLLDLEKKDIPPEHKAANGGIRCFRQIFRKDEHGNKLKDLPRVRCGHSTVKGSLFCKEHNGGNSFHLTTGKHTFKMVERYKQAYGTSVGVLFQNFLNDPDIMSHKKELATLRALMMKYVEKFSSNKPTKNPKRLVDGIKRIALAEELSDSDKFSYISDIVFNERTLMDGDVLDRISRMTEQIGKTITRIDAIERKDDFMLTAEGMKIFLRNVIGLLKRHVLDNDTLEKIRNGLIEVGTKTGKEYKVQNSYEGEELVIDAN